VFPPPTLARRRRRRGLLAPFPATASAEGRQFNGAPSPRWGDARSLSTPPWTTTREVLFKKSPKSSLEGQQRAGCQKTCSRGAKRTKILRMSYSTHRADCDRGFHSVDLTDGYCWRISLRRDRSPHTPGTPDRMRRTSERSAASPDAARRGDKSRAAKRAAERRGGICRPASPAGGGESGMA
jgi:hypothetical protein